MTAVDLLAPPGDEAIARGVDRFVELAKLRYGNAMKAAFLFGSRARGDHRPFSDVDLAIVVSASIDPSAETVPLSGLAYDVLDETGAEIQPWVFRDEDWRNPDRSREAALIRSAKRDAIAVGRP